MIAGEDLYRDRSGESPQLSSGWFLIEGRVAADLVAIRVAHCCHAEGAQALAQEQEHREM